LLTLSSSAKPFFETMGEASYGACVVEEKARDSREGIFEADSH
jgi:hypothetical protein